MAEINDWNVSAGSNNGTPPNGAPEGMQVSDVNNVMRENMAVLKRWYADTNASITPGGTVNAITIAAAQTLTAYYDGLVVAFEAAGPNTGPVTINVDALGDKSVKHPDGSAMAAGEIAGGSKVIAIYDGTNFQVVSYFKDAAVGASETAAAASAAAALVSENNAATSETNAATSATLSEDWATKTDGLISAIDNSAKAYSIGGTGVTDTVGKGAAKEWATKAEDSTVDGSGFSALHHAAKSQASATSSAASAATALAATVGKYQDVISLTSVDSPYTLGAITENTLLNVTTTGGAVIINLPASAGLTDGILVGVNKIGSTNTVTVNPNGADTIGGAASFVQYDDTEWSDLYLNKTITDWQLGNLSYTSAGTGLEKTGSTIGIAAGGVDTTQLADDAVDPTKAVAGVNAQAGTTYTYALTDNLLVVGHSNAAAIAATIPLNAATAFVINETRIDIMNEGAGDLTVSGDTGVTVNGVSGGSFTLTQYQGATIIKRGTDTWFAPNQTVA